MNFVQARLSSLTLNTENLLFCQQRSWGRLDSTGLLDRGLQAEVAWILVK
jgi:hypothetical protein